MSSKKTKDEPRPVFDSIRKPTAPASRKFGTDRPEVRAHPAQRKAKHKKKLDPKGPDADL